MESKKEMAIKTASALFNHAVDENNWKVKDLMKGTRSDLESEMKLVNRVLESRVI